MIYRFGGFALDTQRATLTRDGVPVAVEPQTLQLIQFFVEHRDRLIRREDVVAAIWDGRVVSDWAISAAVKSARKVLGDTASPRRFIATIHGQGFRFLAHAELTAEVGPVTLMVVPFDMLAPDGSQDYLAIGFSDDLRTELAGLGGLVVASRHSAQAWQRGAVDPSTTHTLEGTVRYDGAELRVNAHLRDLATGDEIWGERFAGTGASPFALQDQIIDRLVAALRLTLDRDRTRRPALDPRAYDLCLRGRHAYFQYTPKHLAEALGYFQQAAEIDPTYAEALAYQSYCRCSAFVFAAPGADADLAQARALARKATRLDSTSALALGRLGWVLGFEGAANEAVAAFDAAMLLDPDDAEALHAYGETMNRLGQPERALALLDRAMRLEPFAPPSWDWCRGHARILMGQHQAGLDHILPVLDRVPGLVPALVQSARAYVEMGQIAPARATITRLATVAPRYTLQNATRMFPYPQKSDQDRLITALQSAGLTG